MVKSRPSLEPCPGLLFAMMVYSTRTMSDSRLLMLETLSETVLGDAAVYKGPKRCICCMPWESWAYYIPARIPGVLGATGLLKGMVMYESDTLALSEPTFAV